MGGYSILRRLPFGSLCRECDSITTIQHLGLDAMRVYKILESFYCPQLSTANMGYWNRRIQIQQLPGYQALQNLGSPKIPKGQTNMCPAGMLCLGHSLRTSNLMEVLCPAVVGVGGAGAFACVKVSTMSNGHGILFACRVRFGLLILRDVQAFGWSGTEVALLQFYLFRCGWRFANCLRTSIL